MRGGGGRARLEEGARLAEMPKRVGKRKVGRHYRGGREAGGRRSEMPRRVGSSSESGSGEGSDGSVGGDAGAGDLEELERIKEGLDMEVERLTQTIEDLMSIVTLWKEGLEEEVRMIEQVKPGQAACPWSAEDFVIVQEALQKVFEVEMRYRCAHAIGAEPVACGCGGRCDGVPGTREEMKGMCKACYREQEVALAPEDLYGPGRRWPFPE